jgi:Tfp pilus assembly protein PilP
MGLRTALVFSAALLLGCGDDQQVTSERGPPTGSTTPSAGPAPVETAPAGAAGDEDEQVDAGPPRPPVALDSKSFARRRDPFQSFVATEEIIVEPDRPRAERKVAFAGYAFEDLRLIAIVNSGRGIRPRALFLASDGKSKTIKQGEYFSSAEVLLAAVNRDYVEIEVVDDDLASSLNLQRGERRAIYLRND